MLSKQQELSNDLYDTTVLFYKKLFSPNETIRHLPIPQSHGKVLVYLSRCGPSSITEISTGLAISKPNMTPVINKLLTMELISRDEDPDDRRVMKVALTPKAEVLLNKQEEEIKLNLAQQVKCLCPEDLSQLHQAIQQAKQIVEKLPN